MALKVFSSEKVGRWGPDHVVTSLVRSIEAQLPRDRRSKRVNKEYRKHGFDSDSGCVIIHVAMYHGLILILIEVWVCLVYVERQV